MYTNRENVSLIMAVWLAADDGYDLKPDPNVFSASELLDPIRSIVLSRKLRTNSQQSSVDVMDLLPSRQGHAIHSAIEKSWQIRYRQAMENLGLPKHVIDRVHINADEEDDPDGLYIYIELRSTRMLGTVIISGRFDFVEMGTVKDVKTTKVYSWISGSNDDKYRLQGSIYRWLNPTIIKSDYMEIEFLFTDWSISNAHEPGYPAKKLMSKKLPLLSLQDTENWIRTKINQVHHYSALPQEELPRCTPKETWQKPSTWAYYKDPTKTAGRSTKNFTSHLAAAAYRQEQGNVGVVKERQGEPVFCNYCKGRSACTQAAEYINAGILKP